MDNYSDLFKDKKILVTGGTGSIGHAIVERILQYSPATIRVLTNDENSLFQMSQKINDKNIRFLVGDVRDKERLYKAVEDIDIVFHAAALKHVHLCEYNPMEAVATNVLGTQNMIEACMNEEVDAMLTISTDKAAGPTNVMGATKLLGEKLTTSANQNKGRRKTRFFCVRFGNVLGSRGSVIPLFKERIQKGLPLQLTDPSMTRFFMSYNQAICLLFKCLSIARGSEIFVLKMPVVRIKDLARAAVEVFGNGKQVKIEIIGRRPGEKLYEELLSQHEIHNTIETEDMFMILPDTDASQYRKGTKMLLKAYKSSDIKPINVDQIKKLLASELHNF
jgi:FlaA1/EpsC-like NDP-sugar epimerase